MATAAESGGQDCRNAGGRWWRDIVLFAAGALATSAAVGLYDFGTKQQGAGSLAPAAAARDTAAVSLLPAAEVVAVDADVDSPYVFVQLAHGDQLWRSLALGRALQRVSRYPLVLLTNSTTFPDGTALRSRLRRLNMHVMPVRDVPMPSRVRHTWTDEQRLELLKLQIFRLTRFRRVVLLDTDSIVTRSIDWLFDREPVWSQRGGEACGAPPAFGGEDGGTLSSRLLYVQPSEQLYTGMLEFAERATTDWPGRGHEGLLQDFFKYGLQAPVKLLDPDEASTGACLGTLPGLPLDERGPWSVPAVVFRSSGETNECFNFDLNAQLQKVRGSTVNICHYHPLGAWWRNSFCGAVTVAEIRDPVAAHFCSDGVWYNTTTGGATAVA